MGQAARGAMIETAIFHYATSRRPEMPRHGVDPGASASGGWMRRVALKLGRAPR